MSEIQNNQISMPILDNNSLNSPHFNQQSIESKKNKNVVHRRQKSLL